MGGSPWRGAWDEGARQGGNGPIVLAASWARGEPERGAYDDAELARWRRAALDARKQGRVVWVIAHGGALPDWQVARGGWLDPDALSNWGCWVDRLGRALLEAVDGWFGLWDPIGEARWYEGDARRVARILLDVQAAAYIQLHRGGGAGVPVGAAVALPPPPGGRLRAVTDETHAWLTRGWVRAAATGRLAPPLALVGELPNGAPAIDHLGVIGPGSTGMLPVDLPFFLIGNVDAGGGRVLARTDG